MNSVLQLALTECDKPGTTGTKPLTAMRERRNLMKGAMEAIVQARTALPWTTGAGPFCVRSLPRGREVGVR